MEQFQADIVIIGGGLGGCAAALAAAESGRTVLLTEATDWIGGQATAQLVPPDEHGWIEWFGRTASYQRFRHLVREHYRENFPLLPHVAALESLNPGNAWVSPLAHEPRVAWQVLNEMLAPHVAAGRLRIFLHHAPVGVSHASADLLAGVTVEHLPTGEQKQLRGEYLVDATELGDLLELGGVEHVTGQESHAQTGEPDAPAAARPDNWQAFTWCFAVEHIAGRNFVGPPPEDYARWIDYQFPITPPWPGKLLAFHGLNPRTGSQIDYRFAPNPSAQPHGTIDRTLWTYRRILDRSLYIDGAFASDVTVINWPMNDYIEGRLHHPSAESRHTAQHESRQLSLALLHWLQTEAPRPDGGRGWPGLRLCPWITGTRDGLAKAPYIRESRRLQAEFTVCQQMISPDFQPAGADRATPFADSVGVGSYRIDLHPSTGGDNFIDVATLPFQIPLGALIPVRVENVLPAAKNIGTTHITNGCYRLHPVEWNIGEAAGALAAFCLNHKISPRQVLRAQAWREDFQTMLVARGVELAWPETIDLAEGDPHRHAQIPPA